MRRISEIVEQDLNSRVRKRLTDQPHDAHVILEEFMRIVAHLFAVVFFEKLRVNLLFRRLKLRRTLFCSPMKMSCRAAV